MCSLELGANLSADRKRNQDFHSRQAGGCGSTVVQSQQLAGVEDSAGQDGRKEESFGDCSSREVGRKSVYIGQWRDCHGVLSYAKTDGSLLLKEQENNKAFTPFNDAGKSTYSVYQGFTVDKEEGLYGLGQLQNGQMMQRNMTKVLVQGNVEDVSPIIQSTKGYGVFWDNYSATTYTDNEKETSFRSEVGECIDYYFMYGGSADGVIAQVRALTGEVPMMPLWSYGFMQSKERYKSQEETVGVVKKYRELGIPLDCIIQDWQYWGHNYLWNAMDFQNPTFSRPKQMIDDVHALNAHMMISIWSSFGPATKPYRALDKEGLLFDIETWPQSGVEGWPPNPEYPSGVRVYDAYSPKARDIYWDHLNKGIFQLGMDGWWMDSTEPDFYNYDDSDLDVPTAMGSLRSVRNIYPLMSVEGVYNHQREIDTTKRVFIFTRSYFAGQQRTGANTWSGDITSTWDSFRKQIPGCLNFTLTANPNVHSDIGGFLAGCYNINGWNSAKDNPQFKELYVRWMQCGAFMPMMRSHGTDAQREIYLYGKPGEPVYEAMVDAVKLRYRFLPYIYSQAWQVSQYNDSFMRALFMDFKDDKSTWNNNKQFMFGHNILVCPVLHPLYTEEEIVKSPEIYDLKVNWEEDRTYEVYLPKGVQWYDYWTNEKYSGGTTVNASAPISHSPLYIKAGSILTLGPDAQYANENKFDNVEIVVYPGADATFTLYEDEGDNYNYEKGLYSTIDLYWNDRTKSLTIGKRNGSFPGMLQSRTFIVKIIGKGTVREIHYTGKATTVR